MDGLELARRIRALPACHALALVLLASSTHHGQAQAAREAGVQGYLVKPMLREPLHDCIRAVLGQKQPGGKPRLVTEESLAASRRTCRGRILVAEDNVVNQKVVARVLEKLGYRADIVANGLEAVAALRRIHYDAVLMDCQMPEMDGFAATAEIRRHEGAGPRHVIIALTAQAMDEDRGRCLQAGMDDYLAKPIRPEQVEQILSRWLAGRPHEPASAAPARPHAILDPHRLSELRGLEVLREVAASFIEEVPRFSADLRAALARADAETLCGIAHKLKGSAGIFGADGLVTLCRRIESSCEAGSARDCTDGVKALEEGLVSVRAALERECAS
jgi:CheY-like chemotaxis protein/HPt (histidine-containing phosphotransfer) domain-containing protein